VPTVPLIVAHPANKVNIEKMIKAEISFLRQK
jgi:hypothetical protein